MTSQLPFTLAPLDGEPFGVWLHAYAARLTLTPGHLAGKLGLPCPSRGPAARPAPAQLDAVCAAAGLPPEAVSGMLTACGPSPPAQLLRAWMPQRATRFCPACLAEDPARMPAAWRLPVTFFCLPHGHLLASNCPHCGRRPASLARPSLPAHCGGPGGCGGLLAAASPPPCADVPATRQAQEAISQLLAGIRDPAATAARRCQSLDQLTDVITIAFHLAATAGDPRPARSLTPSMLDASTLTPALALLAAQPGTLDPLAALASGTTPGTTAPAIPESWRTASPALQARIAHPRDPWLHPVDRLRYATTLPAPRAPAPRPPGHPDPAAAAPPGCPTRSGQTGPSALPTPAPPATTGSGPQPWPRSCSRTAACPSSRSPP